MLREINVTEIIKTLQKCRNRSGPGEDQISYLILKNLDRTQLSNIALIFNSCLRTGYFPTAWKQAKVVMLPKLGKDLKTRIVFEKDNQRCRAILHHEIKK